MPRISPFTGLMFDPERVGPLDTVTAPPYDTIGPNEHERLRDASPYNMVHLDLSDDDSPEGGSGKYTRAASALGRWRHEGVLVPTPGPAFYAYEMRFDLQGKRFRVRGLIAEVQLEPWGGSILPHERTMPGPVEDRLALMRAVRADLSPIYSTFRGPCTPLAAILDEVVRRPPTGEMVDASNVAHRIWVLDGAGDVPGWLADRPLMIADGHHRYTTALRYRDEMRAARGAGPWDGVMMLVVDGTTEEPPVLPIHRVLPRWEGRPNGQQVDSLKELLSRVNDDKLIYGTVTREAGELVHSLRRLDGPPPTVCALHEQIIDRLPDAGGPRFTPDADAAEEAVRNGDAEVAFLLPPTGVERIRSVVERHERLPEKSTFFWPKPRTGMVIRPLD